ncbi:hypothetical protein LRE75_33385 [Streptomyces sp. 372A]
MNGDPTTLLGRRYRPYSHAIQQDTVEAYVTQGLDMFSDQEVQLTRIPLPETLLADLPYAASEPPRADPAADRNVRHAVAAVRALTRLPDHHRLTQVFDVLVEGDALWIVSERVMGRTLAHLLRESPPTPLRAAEIAREVLSALRHVHSHGHLHGNITTAQVRICDTGHVVLDGLAQSVAEEALCGVPPRLAAHDEERESSNRPPRRTETGALDQATVPPPSPGRLPARSIGGWAALRVDAQRGAATDRQPDQARSTSAAQPRIPHPAAEAGVTDRVMPLSPLEARRARELRMVRVGTVAERWAPEQAAPVREGSWQLAPPVGPASDLWALGALLFRVLHGHPPFPEEDVSDLVALVCTEPAAFAEESGELRSVIESLLREDPDRRPSLAETDGWLATLLRTAREPAVLRDEPDAARPARLPVLRFHGRLERLRSAGLQRHSRRGRSPSLRPGRLLVVLTLPVAVGVTAYVALSSPGHGRPEATAGRAAAPSSVTGTWRPSPGPLSRKPTPVPGAHDPAGFQIDLGAGCERHAEPALSRVRFSREADGLTLIVAPGRDGAAEHTDPLDYQRRELELAPFRADTDGTADRVRQVDIGARQSLAEGRYSYTGAAGARLYARNQAAVLGGRYHVIFVQGPASNRSRIDEIFDRATATYQPG